MRPRHTAAENYLEVKNIANLEAGFNEAAAYSRGKLLPPHPELPLTIGFNEAAAYSRGKRPS